MKHQPYIGLLFKKNSAIIVMEFMDLKKTNGKGVKAAADC